MAIDAALITPWAITDDGLELVSALAEREHEYAVGGIEALEAKTGRPLRETQTMTIRDGVALLPVQGPLFAKDNIMTRWFGATSYSTLATDFAAALANPEVKAIVGVFNTPGGQVDGASELTSLIKNSKSDKPVVAFVEGLMASAGLWVGSAFDKIYAADTAQVGSLGVQMGYVADAPRPGEKRIRFTSSISPMKNADPETDAGAAGVQKIVDSLAMVFASTVAKNRGYKIESVVENFGKGAMVVAAEAKAKGMIDGISTLEAVISNLSKKGNSMDYASLNAATLAEHRPDLVAAIGEQAVAKINQPDTAAIANAERDRIKSVMAQTMPGHEALVQTLAFDGKTTAAEAALQILAAERTRLAAVGGDRKKDAPAPVNQNANETDANANESGDNSAELDFITNAGDVDKAAKAYMSKNPGTDYLAAVKAVSTGA